MKMAIPIAIVVIVIVIAAAVAFVVTRPAEEEEEVIKIGQLNATDETDLGWTYTAADACRYAELKYGAEVDHTWFVTYADGPRVARDYAARGYDIVWGDGGEYEDAIHTVAPEFPDTIFVAYNSTRVGPSNLLSVFPRNHEGAYLAGIVGAYLTKTKVMAFICGEEYPMQTRNWMNIRLGAQSIDPEIEVIKIVAGTWGDAALGYELAKGAIDTQNVDVFYQEADVTGRGAIEAMKEAGIYHIGCYADQSVLAPEITVTSWLLNKTATMEYVISSMRDGTFEGGRLSTPGLAEGATGLAPFYGFEDKIPAACKQAIEEAKADIINGTLELWEWTG